MGNVGNHNILFRGLGRLPEDSRRVGIRLPNIRAGWSTDPGGIGNPMQGDANIIIQGNGCQLVNRFQLIVQLAADIFAFLGGKFKRCQINKVGKYFGGNFISHGIQAYGVEVRVGSVVFVGARVKVGVTVLVAVGLGVWVRVGVLVGVLVSVAVGVREENS